MVKDHEEKHRKHGLENFKLLDKELVRYMENTTFGSLNECYISSYKKVEEEINSFYRAQKKSSDAIH